MAPHYDLASVQVVDSFREDFAFRIGAATRPEELGRNDPLAFVEALGILRQGTLAITTRVGEQLIEELEKRSHDFAPEMHALDKQIGRQAERLNRVPELGLTVRDR